mgnify:FL=1|tara:strand:- start:305 stop:556 length:252 start_codon:yes stop_codon:yes gene_type:complete
MSKLAQMLTNSKSVTTKPAKVDVFANETGLGLGGMTSKITPLGKAGPLAQEGTPGLSSMRSTFQSSPGGTISPSGESSPVKTT